MNIALILSGGTGSRMGLDTPKQYLKVNNKPVFMYCFEVLAGHRDIDAVAVVADSSWHLDISSWIDESHMDEVSKGKFRGFSEPGKTRQLSIFNGLSDIRRYASSDDNVLIHDAARPLLTEQLVTECLMQMKEHEGVLPVLPMKDTVYLSSDGKVISSLLNRSEVFAGQAPEVFKLEKYYEANKVLLPDRICEINGSSEPAVLAGMDVAIISGDEENFKITTRSDHERFMEVIKNKE